MTQCRPWNFVFATVVAMAAVMPVHAQQYPPSQFQPVAPTPIDPEALKMPKLGLPGDTHEADSSKDAPARLKAPSVNFGKYDLQLDAGKTRDVNPRTGLDSGETSNLSTVTRDRSEGVTPDYFGLKLTVPTHK
jgi:hypothetical protein